MNNGKYLVSVVTPFHNTDMNMFRNCVKSIKEQTIGFNNIEWIVVVHNSKPEYAAEIKSLLDGYENVKVEILNNNIASPSAPRNHGLRMATADYVGFLDSDDCFTPICLKEVTSHIRRSKAQIAWFRREYELETEAERPVTEIVLWDQTREEIVLDRDDWDDEKIFSGVCGMVTSRLYDRRFLIENDLFFDDSVPFGEDYMFNMEAYGHAKRICCLPQLIGYHYFINGKSLVQGGSSKSAETLISYAEGYKKIFDAGLKYGFFMNGVIGGLTCVLARFMVTSEALTLKDRVRIKEIMEPYLELMTPLKVSKIYSETDVRNRYDFPRDVILHPEKYTTDNSKDILIDVGDKMTPPLPQYQDVLRKILKANADTDMGRRYGFLDILTMSGYRSKLPVSDYDVYEPLIRLQTNIGESGIFTGESLHGYALGAGSLSTPRNIPITVSQLKPYTQLFKKILEGNVSILLFDSLPKGKKFNDDLYLNSITGMMLSNYFEKAYRGEKTEKSFATPLKLMYPGEVTELTYLRLLFAMANKNVTQIIAPFTWGVEDAFYFMSRHWKDLTDDIANGTITHADAVSDTFLEELRPYMKADPDRARFLRNEFEKGIDDTIVKRIWPSIKRIVAMGTGTFEIYTERMKRYTGDIPHLNGVFATSEAFIGEETEVSGEYKLSTRNAFVEFVRTDDIRAEHPYLAYEIVPGEEYYMLLTTFSGLYRYRIDEVVRVIRIQDDLPVFTPSYRMYDIIRFDGCTVNDREIYASLKEYSLRSGVSFMDYSFTQRVDEDGIVIIAEPDDEALIRNISLSDASDVLDDILQDIDEDYRLARENGRLAKVKLVFAAPETHLLYRDIERYRRQCAPDQIRPVRNLISPVAEKFFMANTL